MAAYIPLTLAILFTLGLSAFCSLCEAFIMSTTIAEIESLRKRHPHLGEHLELLKSSLPETSAAVLTLNTIANTLGSMVVGWLAAHLFNNLGLGILSGLLTLGILFFAEILPKSIGVMYRRQLQPILILPMVFMRIIMKPITFVATRSVNLVASTPEAQQPKDEEHAQEIVLLAERSAKEGALSDSERDLVTNALNLDSVPIHEIMTPRTVVMALEDSMTVGEVCRDFKNLPFARIPVYHDTIDNIVGIVRRRQLLQAFAEDKDANLIKDKMAIPIFIPDTATAFDTLQLFLQKHQQIAIVVDEFGSTAGVVTMEDIIERLLGREIYEDTDIAVDMREHARKQAQRRNRIPTPAAVSTRSPSAAGA